MAFSITKIKKTYMFRLSFITQFKVEFLLLFTGCRKVLGKIPGINMDIWVKVFKSEPNKICSRKSLKNLSNMVCVCRLSSTDFTWSILEYLDPFLVGFFPYDLSWQVGIFMKYLAYLRPNVPNNQSTYRNISLNSFMTEAVII